MNTIINFFFKNIFNCYIFFIIQFIFIKIKSSNDYYFYDENNIKHDNLSLDECIFFNYIYYTENKRCYKECNYYKVYKGDIGGNCFTNCPTNYPFKNEETKECVKNCPNFFYNKDCKSVCPNEAKYHFPGQKECLTPTNCASKASDVTIYYDSSTYLCDFSCESGKFILENDNSPIECRSSCNDETYKYYYPGINKCLSSCPNFYDVDDRKNKNNKCLEKCSPDDNKYVDIEDKCVNSCPKYKKRNQYKGFMVDKCLILVVVV